jgi:hypothetical protein
MRPVVVPDIRCAYDGGALGLGLLVGTFPGFFGIGRGFLIPGIMLGSDMALLNATGSVGRSFS